MPRKVTVYISAPPGDGLEKSRNWFREYVKVKCDIFKAARMKIKLFSISLFL